MKLPITGGCLCGAVRYEITMQPKRTGLCHCRSCQRATGSSYFPFLHVSKNGINRTGNTTEYTSQGSSGHMIHREFCTKCGSILFGKLDMLPDYWSVSASSLDNPSEFVPEMDIWLHDAQPWDHLNPDLKKYLRNPS